jgi:hypothetical protein
MSSGRYRRGPVGTLAAAGSAIGNAAAITAEVNKVTGADGTKGVILATPINPGGPPIIVINADPASNLKLYPPVNAAIDAGSVNAAITVAPNEVVILYPYSSTQWYANKSPSAAELGYVQGLTPGAGSASKALVLDANSAITSGLTALTGTTINATNSTITTANVTTLNVAGIITESDVANTAATGSAIGNAAALTHAVNVITGTDNTKGVQLPVAAAGKRITVYNSVSAKTLPIYPQVNSTINGGTANASLTLAGLSVLEFMGTSATNWASIGSNNSAVA